MKNREQKHTEYRYGMIWDDMGLQFIEYHGSNIDQWFEDFAILAWNCSCRSLLKGFRLVELSAGAQRVTKKTQILEPKDVNMMTNYLQDKIMMS